MNPYYLNEGQADESNQTSINGANKVTAVMYFDQLLGACATKSLSK